MIVNNARQLQHDEVCRLTIVSVDQNEEVNKISAWGTARFAPTWVGTVSEREIRPSRS
jgi:hypothetical protein